MISNHASEAKHATRLASKTHIACSILAGLLSYCLFSPHPSWACPGGTLSNCVSLCGTNLLCISQCKPQCSSSRQSNSSSSVASPSAVAVVRGSEGSYYGSSGKFASSVLKKRAFRNCEKESGKCELMDISVGGCVSIVEDYQEYCHSREASFSGTGATMTEAIRAASEKCYASPVKGWCRHEWTICADGSENQNRFGAPLKRDY